MTIGPYMSIGNIESGSGQFHLPNGSRVMEVAFWEIALAAGDVIALSKGLRPDLVRPNGLMAYYPCFRIISNALFPAGGKRAWGQTSPYAGSGTPTTARLALVL
jgi:hypothetical protein